MGITEEQENYIKRTRDARMASGKKQHEVADYVGVDRSTYTNYEKRRPMPQKYIAKFCEITGVRYEWLLTGIFPMAKGKEDEITALFSILTEKFKNDEFLNPLLQSMKAYIKQKTID